MHYLKTLEIENVVTYKRAKLRLDKYPLCIIRGKNLDRRSQKSSNASGKTVLLSTIPNILFNSVPSSVRKIDGRDMVGKPGSFIKLVYENNDREYLLHQFFKTGPKLDVERNGKKLLFRKGNDARSFLRKKFPLTENQFYSLVFINGRIPSILQSGSSKVRFDFFENVFRLNLYDILGTKINKEYSKLKVLLQELEVLSKELKHKKDEIPVEPEDENKLIAKQEEINGKLNKIRVKVDTLIEKLNNVRTYLTLAEGVDLQTEMKDLKEGLEETQKEEENIQKLYRKAVKFHEQLKIHKKVEKEKEEIQAKLKELPDEPISQIETVETLLEKYNKKLARIDEKVEANEKAISKRRKLKAAMREVEEGIGPSIIQYKDKSLKVINRSISNHKVERNNLKSSVTSLEEFITSHRHDDNTSCPVCLRDLNKSSAKTMLKLAENQIETRTKQINRLEKIAKFLEYKQEYDDVTIEQISEIDVRTLTRRRDQLAKLLKGLKKKQELKQLLKSLPKIEIDSEEKVPPPDVYEKLLPDLRKRIKNLETSIDKRHRLAKHDFQFENLKDAKDQQKDLEFELNKYRPMLDKAQDILHKLTAKISITQTISKDIDRLRDKIDKLKLDTRDFKIFTSLRKAFGPKGLRKIRTSYFAKQLQNNMNKFASLIFGEPIKFKFLVTNSKFDILAERSNQISDVRKLSGSETSSFTLLLILSILPFIRSQDRCNLLILDEIEAGLDDPSKELFVEKFLPILMKIIPNIFLITPLSEKNFYIGNAQQYTVVKENKISRLEKVVPDGSA
jgi:DNA repair exonuclease SbcCD ATPase subunit